MMNFSLYEFAMAMTLISQDHGHAKNWRDQGATLSPEDEERIVDTLQLVNKICSENGFQAAIERLGRMFVQIRTRTLTYGQLSGELVILYQAIEDGSRYESYYHYPRDKGLLVVRVPGDWAATLKAFPASEGDIKAAVDCYALGHNHACIYHCMMVLESGLPALANRLKARLKKARPTWKDMIEDIRREIDARRSALSATPKGGKPPSKQAAKRQHDLLGFCGEAALEFRFFEHAWRNHIAHGRANYDENDAKKVLEHVRTFMELIATKLKLKEASFRD